MEASKTGGIILVIIIVFLGPVAILLLLVLGTSNSPSATGTCADRAQTPAALPAGNTTVAGFSGTQLKNAALIMDAATDLELPVAAQILGVQAAIGESSLTMIDFGDELGPDSRGLFQQRDNGMWGSYAQRMDPRTSATSFFKALTTVKEWQNLEPSLAIHRVQRNADPNHYTPSRASAVAIVKALSAANLENISASGNCPDASISVKTIGMLRNGTWVSPLPGSTITSGFGSRTCPAGALCNAATTEHKGIDMARGANATVLAPTDMRITVAEQGQGWKAAYGTYVIAKQLDAPGLVFEFHHLVHGSLQVSSGDTVAAGTPLGTEGSTGNATGIHLHFQIATPDAPANKPTFGYAIDPAPILTAQGVL
ncbi:M23 family metallopeptidase [Paeniglutamicibacter cryotolerans]|uniref:Murein DD-endopeptidase MepM/ murein hydrolase activator NlpD n=1 Tax=Paeniglutamicibacter cryotolerans TaxID=670079 RepID=A0A839QMS1_9MICC|nr:M23 family metallopeptidase [Paeniglutamicibacter cryotolerans]MBB2997549.1 murein DD-endopeptidase MepM/ murein hydrolase activator NlpD [Paeniglutamicibacter cryotolerans]